MHVVQEALAAFEADALDVDRHLAGGDQRPQRLDDPLQLLAGELHVVGTVELAPGLAAPPVAAPGRRHRSLDGDAQPGGARRVLAQAGEELERLPRGGERQALRRRPLRGGGAVDRAAHGRLLDLAPVRAGDHAVLLRHGQHQPAAGGDRERRVVEAAGHAGIGAVGGVADRRVGGGAQLRHHLLPGGVQAGLERDAVAPLHRLAGLVPAGRVDRQQGDAQIGGLEVAVRVDPL